jgi:membrane protein implicated in regulation of membrane protease activity
VIETFRSTARSPARGPNDDGLERNLTGTGPRTSSVEDLAFADERIAGVEVSNNVWFAECRSGLGIGDVVAVQEQESLQVEVVDLLTRTAIVLKTVVELFTVEAGC